MRKCMKLRRNLMLYNLCNPEYYKMEDDIVIDLDESEN